MRKRLRHYLLVVFIAGSCLACEDEVVKVLLSPDGRRLLVATRPAGTTDEGAILCFNLADGSGAASELHASFDAVVDDGFAWLPDSRYFIISRRQDDNEDLWVCDAESTNTLRLTTHPARDFGPQVSPDDFSVIFSSTRAGQLDFYSLDLPTRAVQPLLQARQDQVMPQLSPDGQRLFYISYEKGRPEAMLLELESKQTVALSEVVVGSSEPRNVVWLADSSAIVFSFSRDDEPATHLMVYDLLTGQTSLRRKFKRRLTALARLGGAGELLALDETGQAFRFKITGWRSGIKPLKLDKLRISGFDISNNGVRLAFFAGGAVGLAEGSFKAVTDRLFSLSGGEDAEGGLAWLDELLRQDQPHQAKTLFLKWRLQIADPNRRAAFRLAYARLLIDHRRPQAAQLLCLTLPDDPTLNEQVRADAHEIMGELEFDYQKRFKNAVRHYEAARALRQVAVDGQLPERHQLLNTDKMELIKAYAKYLAAEPQTPKSFRLLEKVLKVEPSNAQALELIANAAGTNDERRWAADLLLNAPRADRANILMNLLFVLRDLSAAQEYFVEHFDALIVDQDFGQSFSELVDRIAYPCLFEDEQLDPLMLRFFDHPRMLDRIRPLFDTPELRMKLALFITRIALTREEEGGSGVPQAMLYALDTLQALDAETTGTKQLKFFFWIYTGMVCEEQQLFIKAQQAYLQARLLLPDARLSLLREAELEGREHLGRIDWRELKVWIDFRLALSASAEQLGDNFRRFHESEKPLRLLRLCRPVSPEQLLTTLNQLFVLLPQVKEQLLRGLCAFDAGYCLEQLDRERLSLAYYRMGVDLQPLRPLRMIGLLRLGRLAERQNDPYLAQWEYRRLTDLAPDDPLTILLFADEK